jgi:RecB family exonuclease
MGGNVHSTLADFLGIIPGEERTVATIEDLLRRKWRRNRRGFAGREEEQQWAERALAQLRWFVNTQMIDVRPLLLERFHEAPVSENLVVNGRIDRIDQIGDGTLHVIDYKTGKVPEKVDSFQLLVYVLILSRTLTYPVSQASYLYLSIPG